MKTIIHQNNDHKIAEIISPNLIINNANDLLDLVVDPDLDEVRKVIIHQKNISPQFFDLRSGIAGEIVQKLVNYHLKLAIIGDFKSLESKSLHAFIVEANRGKTIFFADSLTSAKKYLEK